MNQRQTAFSQKLKPKISDFGNEIYDWCYQRGIEKRNYISSVTTVSRWLRQVDTTAKEQLTRVTAYY